MTLRSNTRCLGVNSTDTLSGLYEDDSKDKKEIELKTNLKKYKKIQGGLWRKYMILVNEKRFWKFDRSIVRKNPEENIILY